MRSKTIRIIYCLAVIAAWGILPRVVFAAGNLAPGEIRFDREVWPILQKCIGCHGPDRPKADLDLTQSTSALELGVIVPHQAVASPLMERIRSTDPDFRMPPDGALTAPEITTLRSWIDDGASWPTHWAYRRLSKPRLPDVVAGLPARWYGNPIDRFVAARMALEHLTPSPPADRRTLLRRLYYDLLGVPPTAEALDRFESDDEPDAYERLVDQLLARPELGERWARHWMDLVHFAETHGHDQDRPRENAWPYRDYLIRRFNRDVPYPRFLQEQIAGDCIFPDDPSAIAGTGMLAAGPWDESSLRDIQEDSIDREIGRYLDRDDMVTTVMSTFASTSAHCARCHHHKFDPISQDEYYGLQAVFAGIDKANRPYDSDPRVAQRRAELQRQAAAIAQKVAGQHAPWLQDPDVQREVSRWEADYQLHQRPGGGHPTGRFQSTATATATASESKSKSAEPDPFAGKVPPEIATILSIDAAERTELDRLQLAGFVMQQRIQSELQSLPAPELVYCGTNQFAADGSFRPAPGPRTVHVLDRGEISKPLREAAATSLSCVEGLPLNTGRFRSASEADRRVALAEWLSSTDNGLVWRSAANRMWQYHFGQPLVATPSDFGHAGSLPTHPELLDWLAVELQQHHGSLKSFHRLIVTSATYQQSSEHREEADRIDANNRWLWRMQRRRLDAEAFRDSLLTICGVIDNRMGGPSDRQFVQSPGIHVTPVVDYQSFDVDDRANYRRSVYRFIFRTIPDPLMEALDCPDASQLTTQRAESVTAVQALATMNDKFVVRQSQRLAAGIAGEWASTEEQVIAAYRHILGRQPTSEERTAVAEYTRRHGLPNSCRLLLNTNEFMFVE